jgi:hypothetical protein
MPMTGRALALSDTLFNSGNRAGDSEIWGVPVRGDKSVFSAVYSTLCVSESKRLTILTRTQLEKIQRCRSSIVERLCEGYNTSYATAPKDTDEMRILVIGI